MDADLSHPPECITDLLAALDADCDMVRRQPLRTGRAHRSDLEPLALAEFPIGNLIGASPGQLLRSHVGFFRYRPPHAAGP